MAAHDHAHQHHHHGPSDPHDDHAHSSVGALRAFRWGTALNIGLVLVQGTAGLALGSVALLADAVHNAATMPTSGAHSCIWPPTPASRWA